MRDRAEYERELDALREALALPVVGRPTRAQNLARLGELIHRYPEAAQAMLAEQPDGT